MLVKGTKGARNYKAQQNAKHEHIWDVLHEGLVICHVWLSILEFYRISWLKSLRSKNAISYGNREMGQHWFMQWLIA